MTTRTRKPSNSRIRTVWITPSGSVVLRRGGRGFDGFVYPVSQTKNRELWEAAQSLLARLEEAVKAGELKAR